VKTRVTLREAALRDLPLIEPWYAEAARAAYGGEIPAGDPDLGGRFVGGGLWVVLRDGEEAPIGSLDAQAGWPAEGWVTIEWLGLSVAHRGWGYGSEAVRQFEKRHTRARLVAQIHPRNGLALYFWLRLGYRPMQPEEVFWRAQNEGGIIAMIRHA
jgi:RimJ/RimL family protein N-acetyltransferase